MVNGAALLTTAALVERIGRRELGRSALGPAAGLTLLLYPPYFNGMVGAGAMPVAVALLALVLTTVRPGRWPLTPMRLVSAGAAMALLTQTRFDQLLLVAVLPCVLVAMRATSPRRCIWWIIGFTVVSLPWMVHSWVRFDVPFATMGQGDPLRGLDPRDWYPPGADLPTVPSHLREAFGVQSLASQLGFVARAAMGFIAPLLVGVAVATRFLTAVEPGASAEPAPRARQRTALVRLLLIVATVLLGTEVLLITMTAWQQFRYLVPSFFLFGVAALITAPRWPIVGMAPSPARTRATVLAAAALAFVACYPQVISHASVRLGVRVHLEPMKWEIRNRLAVENHPDELARCTSDSDHVLSVVWRGNGFGATTGRSWVQEPRNIDDLTQEDRATFLEMFDVTAVAVSPTAGEQETSEAVARWSVVPGRQLVETCTASLYRLEPQDASTTHAPAPQPIGE